MIQSIKKKLNQNREISLNILAAFGVRGISMVISLFTMPAYIRFFNDKTILGVWYTLLSLLNWVLYFDLGLGNGLRNMLPLCIANNDYKSAKKYVSTTYFSTAIMVSIWSVFGFIIIPKLNWNSILNVDSYLLNNESLYSSIRIVFLGIMLQFVFKLITSILYALQKSALVNSMALITTIITLIIVSVIPTRETTSNLTTMAWINVLAVNMPYAVATIIVFATKLKKAVPQLSSFSKECLKEVLNIGLVLLWLQLVFMIISNTNEMLISHLTGSSSVVEYQAYNKIYNTVSSIFSLALVPIWSAVTKASAEKRYAWIQKLNKILLLFCGAVFVFELAITPFLQYALNIWLGKNYIMVNPTIALIFVCFNSIIFLHNVNTSMCNGMSFFKVQIIWMTFAAIIDIPLALFFVCLLDGNWIGVILANIIALLPFEVIEIFAFNKYIKKVQAMR